MRVEFFGYSDIGKKREFNEDRYLCLEISDDHSRPPLPIYLFAVADGIGGHAGGEVASSLAVEILKDNVIQRVGKAGDGLNLKRALEESFHQANQDIFRHGSGAERLAGMGTTLVAAIVAPGVAAVANVGDSRLYLIHDRTLTRVSQDHTWVAEQVRRKIISEKDGVRSPFRNMVTRSLGYASEIEVDSFDVPLAAGDWLLLCTDGLYGSLPDRLIRRFFKKSQSAEEVCRKLVAASGKRGSQDNITAVVISIRGA